jgi:hypothetical protein
MPSGWRQSRQSAAGAQLKNAQLKNPSLLGRENFERSNIHESL